MEKRIWNDAKKEKGERPPVSMWGEERLKRLKELAESNARLEIRLTNDFAFKKTFRNKKALAGLLSALLEIPVEEIRTLEFPDTFLHGDYADDREGILDVKVHLNDHTKINVEMQINLYPFWEERSLFYLSRMFTENFKKGEEYSSLETCIHISILGFGLPETEGFYSVIELRNRKNGRLYSDKLSLRVVYLSQLEHASEADRQTDVYRWAKMISAKDWEELKAMADQNDAMREAYEEVEKINADCALRWQYLKEEMRASDEATLRHWCFQNGMEDGKREGERIGKEIGERIGKEIGERIGKEIGEKIGKETGEKIGKKKGEQEASERYSRLILKLAEDGRQDEIVKAAAKPEYLNELYTEYQI